MEKSNIRTPFLVFCFLGFVVSLLLLNTHVERAGGFSKGPSICTFSATFDCEKVDASSYSKFFGTPVSVYALFFFAALFLFVLVGERRFGLTKQTVWSVAVCSITMALLPSVFLLYISIFELEVLCPLCLLLDLLLALSLLLAVRASNVGFFSSLKSGVLHYVSFAAALFGRSEGESGRCKRAWMGFIWLDVLLFASLATPALLEVLLHQPWQQESSKKEREFVARWMEQWRITEPSELPVIVQQSGFGDQFRGELEAPFTVIEFADFQCSHCRKTAPLVEKLIEEHRDLASFVFKTYPLDSQCNRYMAHAGNALSCQASAMVRCAGEQGKARFWEMHDALFAIEFFGDSALKQLPTTLGFDEKLFASCMRSPEVQEGVQRDIELAQVLGVQGTPSFFIYQKGKILAVPSVLYVGPVLDALRAEQK